MEIFLEILLEILRTIENVIWGPVMLIVLAGGGIYLTIGLGFLQFRKLGYGLSELFKGRKADEKFGDLTPFNALMTALSGTVGTGNIVGVATAIFFGGPGALFYMWVIALIGMATKYSECLLGVEYREKTADGNYTGGPMYYIKKGIGGKFGSVLGSITAVIIVLSAFGIGNSTQSNSMADAMQTSFGLPTWATGIILAILVGLVIMGGVKRIGTIAGKLVPLMFILYIVGGLIVILAHLSSIGAAFGLIFQHAFSAHAAAGGFAGATIAKAIQFGIARGVFSNESGLGSAAIAHASAQTRNPVRQAHIAMLGTFFDTIVICTITGLAIVITDAYQSGTNGVAMTIHAFSSVFGSNIGGVWVTVCLAIFVFTTIITWSLYGERGLNYLGANKNIVTGYRILWIALIVVSADLNLNLVWAATSIILGLLVYPNILALLWLSPKIFAKTKDYWQETQS